MGLTLRSSSFTAGGEIPRRHTCDGENRSPALAWTGVPTGTKSLALIVDDPDAPDPAAPRMTYVHWVLFNLPAAATGLPEGATGATLPAGAREGLNDWRRAGYGGPCPPVGRHRYFFKLYALDTTLSLESGRATKSDVEKAIKDHILDDTELMGTYQKQR